MCLCDTFQIVGLGNPVPELDISLLYPGISFQGKKVQEDNNNHIIT